MPDEDLIELVGEARPHLLRADPETDGWLVRLEERHGELHDLVERLLREDPVVGAGTCAALWNFWWQKGHLSEGREGRPSRRHRAGSRPQGPRHDRLRTLRRALGEGRALNEPAALELARRHD